MLIVVCDIDGCDNPPEISGVVVDPDSDWKGMEFDLCSDHAGIGSLIDQWDAEYAESEIEVVEG